MSRKKTPGMFFTPPAAPDSSPPSTVVAVETVRMRGILLERVAEAAREYRNASCVAIRDLKPGAKELDFLRAATALDSTLADVVRLERGQPLARAVPAAAPAPRSFRAGDPVLFRVLSAHVVGYVEAVLEGDAFAHCVGVVTSAGDAATTPLPPSSVRWRVALEDLVALVPAR